jgi:hypothetical protein
MALSVRHVVNDYAMLTDKVSEYLYMPIIEHVNGLVLRRKSFVKLYEEHYWQSRFGN